MNDRILQNNTQINNVAYPMNLGESWIDKMYVWILICLHVC